MSGKIVQAVATARHLYDGRALRPGDEFECSESELADLRVLGFAQAAPRQSVLETASKAVYETAVMIAAPLAGDELLERVKRRYRRRDMQAPK